jgi:hypothetical protein
VGTKATLDEGPRSRVQWNREILLDESHKLHPQPLDESPRPKSGKSRLNRHGTILDGRSNGLNLKKKGSKLESSWFEEPRYEVRFRAGSNSRIQFTSNESKLVPRNSDPRPHLKWLSIIGKMVWNVSGYLAWHRYASCDQPWLVHGPIMVLDTRLTMVSAWTNHGPSCDWPRLVHGPIMVLATWSTMVSAPIMARRKLLCSRQISCQEQMEKELSRNEIGVEVCFCKWEMVFLLHQIDIHLLYQLRTCPHEVLHASRRYKNPKQAMYFGWMGKGDLRKMTLYECSNSQQKPLQQAELI